MAAISRRLEDATIVRSLVGWRDSHFAGILAARVGAGAAPQKTTYTGDVVIAAYVVNAGKEADYEKVIATLKDALAKSPKPEAKQQLAGWKVIKNSANQPDGSPLYLHIITPGRQGCGLFDHEPRLRGRHRPDGAEDFFNLYKGALQKPLFVIQGPIASDFSK